MGTSHSPAVKRVAALQSGEDSLEVLLSELRSETLRDRLFEAGVSRLHLNLHDQPVRGAQLQLSHVDPPIRAFVSTWGGDESAILALLTDVARKASTRLQAWEVEAAEPITPPTTPDGERCDALVNVAVLRRPAGLSETAYVEAWQGHHTQVAIDTQDTFGYVQNRVVRSLTTTTEPVAAIVEEFFRPEAMTDFHAFFGSGGDDAELGRRMELMNASIQTFGADRDLDVVPTSRYCWRAP